MLNPEVYLNEQEAKIISKVARLFASTVYENKLIQQAKKILTNWKRVEDENKKMQYKMESEKEALQGVSGFLCVRRFQKLAVG